MKPLDKLIIFLGIFISVLIFVTESGILEKSKPSLPSVSMPSVQIPAPKVSSVPPFTIPHILSMPRIPFEEFLANFIDQLSKFSWMKKQNEGVLEVILPTPTPMYPPVSLSIPKLGLKAQIDTVGVTETGNMDTPQNASNVGWYRYGPTPGVRGNSVITGHYDTPTGRPAIFYRLKTLNIGDTVEVQASGGKQFTFIVTGKNSIPISTFPSDFVFQDKYGVNLNLITCAGVWDKTQKIYNERLVVYTTLKGTQFNSLQHGQN